MVSITKFSIFIIFLAILFSGCKTPSRLAKQLDCYVPEILCEPGQWSGEPFDTAKANAKEKGYYLKIEPVKDINTPENEWQLSFISHNRAVFTYDDSKLQKMLIARMITPERFAAEEGISTPFISHAGSFSAAGKNVVFAASPVEQYYPDEVRIDSKPENVYIAKLINDTPQLDTFEMLPLEYMIGQSRLYTASLEDNVIVDPEEVEKKEAFDIFDWESQPAYAFGGKVIFYAADIEGGYGGTDIWYKYKTASGWSMPINAGANINTTCDDLTPFVSSDNKSLYFSSLGHATVGGYDIFKAEIMPSFASNFEKPGFYKAVNPGAPLNTSFDELFPSCPGGCDSIFYFSSNQGGEGNMISRRGGFDIYVMHKIVPEELKRGKQREEKKPDIAFDPKPEFVSPDFTIEGTVYDEATGKPADSAEIIVEKDDEPFREIQAPDGDYTIKLKKGAEYEVTAQKEDRFYDTYKVNIPADDTTTYIRKDFVLPSVMSLRINFEFDKWENPYRYTLDSNGIETSVTWSEELDKLAQNIIKAGDKIVKVILVGHTDQKGSNDYNDRLGRRRVDFVINELVKRGVKESILDGRTAGESEPLPKRSGEDDAIYDKRLRRVTLEKVLEK